MFITLRFLKLDFVSLVLAKRLAGKSVDDVTYCCVEWDVKPYFSKSTLKKTATDVAV